MSAFLGPIHYKMFNKILAVGNLAYKITILSDTHGWSKNLAQELEQRYPLPQGNLEDILDLTNIHGSLAPLVALAENRLAMATQQLPLTEKTSADCIVENLLNWGALAGQELLQTSTAKELWQKLDNFWLDGMPCDGAVKVKGSDDTSVSWEFALNIHPAKHYAKIRYYWSKGFVEVQGYKLLRHAENYWQIS